MYRNVWLLPQHLIWSYPEVRKILFVMWGSWLVNLDSQKSLTDEAPATVRSAGQRVYLQCIGIQKIPRIVNLNQNSYFLLLLNRWHCCNCPYRKTSKSFQARTRLHWPHEDPLAPAEQAYVDAMEQSCQDKIASAVSSFPERHQISSDNSSFNGFLQIRVGYSFVRWIDAFSSLTNCNRINSLPDTPHYRRAGETMGRGQSEDSLKFGNAITNDHLSQRNFACLSRYI